MKIAVIGPHDLTELDRHEIRENIGDAFEKGNEIHVLAYRSIENEVFKYVLERDLEDGENFAPRLHVYTLKDLERLHPKLKDPIDVLMENGAKHTSFGMNEAIVTRSPYTMAWKSIMETCDSVISFFDASNEETIGKLTIPIDVAKSLGKRGALYPLPRMDESMFLKDVDEKVRIVE
ncbi:hypothetical protein IMZ31_20595 (plasmid) [Pontibacillus sp. ALD_SL1]|uniref:hypothetical protein n=1 Tax=Pontibacillus sp. ALD_SL1 TaxID=2777185 RepID=UPI001A957321|nr:hypothetical protein [Pontibacillus sp. ALD_SL1]QST02949.1 hypothetical protein IMZ31_20595 [Pontibacillus sp. ALD_SL1]